MASDGDWFWPLAGAALIAWFAYDKWWKVPDAPPRPPLPVSAPYSPIPVRPKGLVYVTTLGSGAIWRIEADSVKGDKNNRIVWVNQDQSKNSTERARTIMTLYRLDCDTTASALLSIVHYDKEGKVLLKDDQPDAKAQFSPPGTVMGSVFQEACKDVYDPPVSKAAPPPPSPNPA